MKFFAGRPRDLADIAALVPTADELEFTRCELPRLTRIDPTRADRMRDALKEFSHAKG